MMRLLIAVFFGIGCALLAGSVEARLTNPNPNATISFAGPDAFSVTAPGATIPYPFAVRVVDPSGNPIEGLTVEFFTDPYGCIGEDPNCHLPPPEVYGHFPGDLVLALTDADGIASANGYIGGTVPGTYLVGAFISEFDTQRNKQVLQGAGDIFADFTITQFVASTASVPATTTWSKWMLLGLLAGLGCVRVRWVHLRDGS